MSNAYYQLDDIVEKFPSLEDRINFNKDMNGFILNKHSDGCYMISVTETSLSVYPRINPSVKFLQEVIRNLNINTFGVISTLYEKLEELSNTIIWARYYSGLKDDYEFYVKKELLYAVEAVTGVYDTTYSKLSSRIQLH